MSGRQTLAFVVLALLAAISSYFVWLRLDPELPDQFVGPPRSDYELGKFDMQVFDEEGTMRYFVEAPRLARDAERESFIVDAPRVRLYDRQGQHWLAVAKTGYIDSRADRIDFQDDVDLRRESTQDPMRFRSEFLSAFPKQGKITTDQPIRMDARGATLTGTGFQAELEAKTFEIQHDFQASLPTPRSR